MPFSIIQSDLIEMRTDAIVNATDRFYSGGGGVDYAIHQAAGPELSEACGFLGRLHRGEVKATGGYSLPVKYIFHTSGPHRRGGTSREMELLGNCYKNSIALARNKKCKSIAFPLISSQGKHFPKEIALTVAINTIREALKAQDDIDVYLVVYGKRVHALSETLFPEILQIIETDYRPSNEYIEELVPSAIGTSESMQSVRMFSQRIPVEDIGQDESRICAEIIAEPLDSEPDIDKLIEELIHHPTQKNLNKLVIDENFAHMLARLMKDRGLKQAQLYDELGMTNVGFWKLLKGKSNPSKMTVFGLAIALKLSIEETKEMLMKAGYAVNMSSLQDVIIAGLIQNKVYDRCTMDNLLYALDLQLLPGAIID